MEDYVWNKLKLEGNLSTKLEATVVKNPLKQFATFLGSKQVSPSISKTTLLLSFFLLLYPSFFNWSQSFFELPTFSSILFVK